MKQVGRLGHLQRSVPDMGLGNTKGAFKDLGPHAGEINLNKSMPPGRLQPIGKIIAHHHLRLFRQAQPFLDSRLRGPAGGENDLGKSRCPGHLHGCVNGIGPGPGRNRPDNTGGAENGQAAQDAKPGIKCLFRQNLAIGNADGHL